MANIQTWLNNIRYARYGKDVRSSICKAIEIIDGVADTAQNSATSAASSAKASELSARNSMESAKTSEENAKTYMENAFAGTPEGYADLVEKVGLLDIAKSTDFTLYKSFAGGYRLKEMEGNTVQNKDILKYTGGAVSLNSSTKTFTYTLPTPLVIEPNEKYTIVLENMNGGGEYSPSDTYAEILFSDSIGTLLYPWVLVGTNTMSGEIGIGDIAKIQITAKTSSLTFSSIRIEHDATPDYPQPLNHYGDCVEMIQGYLSGGNYTLNDISICTKHKIPCNSGDTIKVVTELSNPQSITISYYKDGVYNSSGVGQSTKEAEFVAPNGVTHFTFNVNSNDAITVDTVGKIQLTVNGKYVNCIKSHGKNLFDKGTVSGTRNVTCYNEHFSKGTYTISADITSSDTDSTSKTCLVQFINQASGGVYSVYMTRGDRQSATINLLEDTNVINFYASNDWGKSENDTFAFANVQIEASSNMTEYEPYKETIAWYYTNEPTRLEDYMFNDSDGLFKIKRNRGHIVYDETANVNINASGCIYFPKIDNAKTNSIDVLCNVAKNNGTTNSVENNVAIFSNGAVIVGVMGFSTPDEVKTWLADNNIEIEYPLATPTIEVLDTQSQINLNSIETFDGVTYLECDSRVKPLGIKGEYGTSKVGALALENANLRDKAEINAFKVKKITVTGTTTSTGTLETGLSKNAHIITATCEGRLCIPFVTVVSAGGRPSVAVFDYSLNPVADTNVTVTVSYYED